MTHDKTGGPAFPATTAKNLHYEGMTLRDWFAGQALVGEVQFDADRCPKSLASAAYEIADAMLREREDTTND
jgi:hypothetical protein